MTFNINDFKSTLNKYGGLARKNLYVVEIFPPRGEFEGFSPIDTDGMSFRDLRFFCMSATIPGLNYNVADYYPNGFGERHSMPVSMTMDPLNLVFMLDSDHMVLRFFHSWMQKIINYNNTNPLAQINDQLPYEIGYKREFSCRIVIKHYSTDSEQENSVGSGSRWYEYTLDNAFPTQISGVDVSWSDNDSFATSTINFNYSNITMSGTRVGIPTERFSRSTGFLDLINNIGLTGQVINQVNLPRSIQDAVDAITRANLSLRRFNSGVSRIRTGIRNIGSIF